MKPGTILDDFVQAHLPQGIHAWSYGSGARTWWVSVDQRMVVDGKGNPRRWKTHDAAMKAVTA